MLKHRPENTWAFLGFGEAAAAFVSAGLLNGQRPTVVLLHDRAPTAATQERLRHHGLQATGDAGALRAATVVLSLVTPDVAVDVAHKASEHLSVGAFYVDLNSIAGRTAREIAGVVESRGMRFVDAAVMGPVPLQKLRVPIWLSGAAAAAFHDLAARQGLNTTVISARAGDASALKMLWSVMTKGTIGLYAEALVAAHRLGLLEPMLEMIGRDYGTTGTQAMILRMLGSTAASGDRRLGEMEEARKTLEDAGVPSWTVDATVKWIAALNGLPGVAAASGVPEVVEAASDALSGRTDVARKIVS